MLFTEALPLRILCALVVAALCAWGVTPSAESLALRLHALDLPGERRRVHSRAVPRLGGLAIFTGFFASALCFCAPGPALAGVLRGAVLIALMGAADDCFSLRSPLKLAVQLVAALTAFRAGARISSLTVPGPSRFVPVGELSLPLTVLWMCACTNAMNLIDGLDGLAAGVAAIGALCMLLVAAAVSEGEIAVLLAALAGACLGFLPYNRSPARIFMGDTGSQLLGYLLGAASMLGMFKSHALLTFFVPLLALGLPLLDTAFAFTRRALRGQNPLHADRGHIHHRLLDMGLSPRNAVRLLCSVSAALGLAAVMLASQGSAARALAALLMSFAGAAALSLIRARALAKARASRRG
ncbi:MAG: undecaprenyl/decaprenyl-phosphate alpha-N-acetylglucosaminyl 1-phosphate transferase [Oscillospiraceae bacterium]|nr:undecaprenyl/decaprenyl-phosphate alpha-N-acetylglucosaminyl 1-phosphate transferase [Oscillospiraceae bacterium]